MKCGGLHEPKPADEEIQKVVDEVKEAVLLQRNGSCDLYQAVSYTTQVVAGTNYFVKVKVGSDDFLHLRIFRPLPPNHEKLELHSLQSRKAEHDPISHF